MTNQWPASLAAFEYIATSTEGDRHFRGNTDVERWKVCEEDARELLGGVSQGIFDDMKPLTLGEGTERTLEADRLLRISLLIGIFKALGVLHWEALANRWVHLPNTNRIFGGRTPRAFMVQGGPPAMQTVRRLLDARCTGR